MKLFFFSLLAVLSSTLAQAQGINPPPTITTFNQTKGSTGGTITGFGVALGQALGPLVSVGGQPGLFIPSGGGLVWNMNAAARTDFATFRVVRTTSYTGGTASDIVRALGAETNVGVNDGANEWNFVGKCTSASTALGALCLGGYFQAIRSVGATTLVKGVVAAAVDNADAASSVTVAPVNSLELNVQSNAADDEANGQFIGGVGVRSGLHLVAIRQLTSDTAQTQFAYGIWLSTSTLTGLPNSDTHTNYMTGYGFGINAQAYSAFDSRGAIAPTGSSNPVYALNMDAGHAIEFKGDDTTLAPAPARTLLYTSSLLSYQVLGVTKFSISDTGAVNATSIYGSVRAVSITTDTPTAADCGNTIEFTNSGAVTVTVPNSLPIGCQIALAQYGTGKVSTSAGAGATQRSPHGYTGTSAEYTEIYVHVIENSGGAAAVYSLLGDGA